MRVYHLHAVSRGSLPDGLGLERPAAQASLWRARPSLSGLDGAARIQTPAATAFHVFVDGGTVVPVASLGKGKM